MSTHFYTKGKTIKTKSTLEALVIENYFLSLLLIVNKVIMVNKGILRALAKDRDIGDLEMHLIYSYLKNKKINYQASPLLSKYLGGYNIDASLYIEVENLGIKSIKQLENYLELIIPDNDRKLNGAFFTPEYIIDFIIEELKPQYNHKNLDPSCGCGAFLVGLVEYYKNHFGKSIRNTVRENIFGADILEYNIHRAKLLLSILGLQNGEILEESDFNLFHQDSLRSTWNSRFDIIVGNPPYVKFQDLTVENRKYLAKNWTTVAGGTFNLYFAFFELGFKLLEPTGRLAYITPNNYFTSLSGEAIRRYFQQKKCVSRIIDFNSKKVFDVQTYTAITFINRKENDIIIFDRIKDDSSPENFLEFTKGSPNYLRDLNPRKWRLLKTDEQRNIKILETIGMPIGKMFDICVGIATLKDEVFFVDGTKMLNGNYQKVTDRGEFEIEKECTRPVYKISDFKSQEEIEKNSRLIIFPYELKNGIASAIPEKDFKLCFPKCYTYLLSEKEKLDKRDKGKVKYSPFFAWGRTQGLTRTGKRILTPTFSQAPRFLLVEEESSFFTNGYGLFFKEQTLVSSLFPGSENPVCKIENVDIVLKILNSYLMHYYVCKTSVAIEGGYPCYQKNFIEKFSIPDFTEEEINELRVLTDKQEIDDFLMEKYQLKRLKPNLLS